MKIKNIKRVQLSSPETVYDLQVSSINEPTFICQGVVVHNSDICRYRDQRTWFYDFPEKSTLPGQVTPPAHFSCRSTTTPVLKSFRELGFDQDELPIGTRSSLNGYVPADTNYYGWFNDLDNFVVNPEKVRRDVLGVVRYDLWKKNQLKIQDFYSRDGRLLTLNQLKDRDYQISKQYTHYITEEG